MIEKLFIQGVFYYTGHRLVKRAEYIKRPNQMGGDYISREESTVARRQVLFVSNGRIEELEFETEDAYIAWRQALDPKKEG